MSEPVIPPVPQDRIPRKALTPLARMSGRPEQSCNSLRTVARSQAALEALAAQISATSHMRLPSRTREAIALRVAELNGCDYCLAALTALLDCRGEDTETTHRFRQGLSDDPKEQTLLALATKLVVDRGHHTRFAVEAAREVGVRDQEIVEVVALVALDTFANYLNSLAQTEIDFPAIDHGEPLIADQERPQDRESGRSQEG